MITKELLTADRPLFLRRIPWPMDLRILVLAPHPDDFDAIAVTLRYFRNKRSSIHLSVVSSSSNGVENSFCSPPTADRKTALREEEQAASCRLFGLPDKCLTFLRLADDEEGHPRDTPDNFMKLHSCLLQVRPDLVFLPHGNDSNAGHRRTFALFERSICQIGSPITALLNRDPKTLQMRSDLYTFFGEEEARWKAELLRCHQSQHQRNLNTRGYGFDERILRLNRLAAREVPNRDLYAEVFEIWPTSIENIGNTALLSKK